MAITFAPKNPQTRLTIKHKLIKEAQEHTEGQTSKTNCPVELVLNKPELPGC